MVEYGVNVNNKFALHNLSSDDEAEDPSVLLEQTDVKKDDRTPAQKKADKKAEKLKKEKAAAKEAEAKKAAAAAKEAAAKVTGKENARPDSGRGRGRGGPRGGGGAPRPPRENDGERREFGEGRGRGGPRGGGRGRGAPRGGRGAVGGEEHREVTSDEAPKDGEVQVQPTDGAPRGGGFRGRGRGAYRGDGGERPPRDFGDGPREDRPPRDFGDRPPRDFGDRPHRGGPRGRGGRFGDRQSGSDRTGVKPVDSKEGHGKGNWGSNKDEIEAAENAENVEKTEEETPAQPREKTAEELEQEALEAELAKQKTLAEFRAELKKDDAKFNIRQAGEGADDKAFGKLIPLKRDFIEDESTVEEVVVLKKEPRNKQIIVDFKFANANRGGEYEFRGGRGRGGDRGRRGTATGGRGGAMRGGRGGGGRNSYGEPFKVAEEAFPALGSA